MKRAIVMLVAGVLGVLIRSVGWAQMAQPGDFLPVNPMPPDGATEVPLNTWLKWTIADTTKLYMPEKYRVIYFVFFAKADERFSEVATYVEGHQPLNDYRGMPGGLWPPFVRNDELPPLEPATTYKWKVVVGWWERIGGGYEIERRIEGPVWTFTTTATTESAVPNLIVSTPSRGNVPLRSALRVYPNPLTNNTVVTVEYTLSNKIDEDEVNVVVYNLLGQKVRELVRGRKPAGTHTVRFNAAGLPSGVYIVVLQTGRFTISQRVLLLK